ncbi:NADH-quinone oxidoreductase subunit C [Angustibacter aerolatus]
MSDPTGRQPKDQVGDDNATVGQTRRAAAVAQEAAPQTAEIATTTPEAEVVDVRTGMFGAHGPGDTSGYGGLVRPVVMSAPSARPFDGWWDEVAQVLVDVLPEHGTSYEQAIEKAVVEHGEITFFVRRERLVEVARVLRDEPATRFEMCVSVSGVHYPHEVGRELHSVYHLLSLTNGSRRIRLEVVCPEGDTRVPSVCDVWPGANWHERETWDLFGIVYDGHPALTRILMPDDWPGHPQRKDYPLGGIPVEYKGAQIAPPDQRRSYS